MSDLAQVKEMIENYHKAQCLPRPYKVPRSLKLPPTVTYMRVGTEVTVFERLEGKEYIHMRFTM